MAGWTYQVAFAHDSPHTPAASLGNPTGRGWDQRREVVSAEIAHQRDMTRGLLQRGPPGESAKAGKSLPNSEEG